MTSAGCACSRGNTSEETRGTSSAALARDARPPVAASSSASPRHAGVSREPAAQAQRALYSLAATAAATALDQVRALKTELESAKSPKSPVCFGSPSYLAARRAIFSAKAWWRLAEAESAEVLLGPLRPSVEGGGELGLLDLALRDGDCARAVRSVFQVESALRLIQHALRSHPEDTQKALSRLSLMALDLGGVLLESTPDVSLSPAGVLADALGTLDGLERGAQALSADRTLTAESLRRIRALREALGSDRTAQPEPGQAPEQRIKQRARLVRDTGLLGQALRQLIERAGLGVVAPPFKPHRLSVSQGVEGPVSVLTLPAPRVPTPPGLVRLGELLFFDRQLSKDAQRSCATCHDPARGFSDGKSRPTSFDPATPLLRNTPSLLYTANQASFLWDGRLLTAKRQALRVIHSPAEMGISPDELLARLKGDAELSARFAQEFPDGVSLDNVGRALAAFQAARLDPGDAPLDRFARGDDSALSAAASRGLDVFAGKARCARCHVPPLFAGTRPSDFGISIFAAIGVPSVPGGGKLDSDDGRFRVTHMETDRGVFKTPSVRDIQLSAPYFHNGAFKTLEQVVDFYDQGGGRGLGFEVPNQDPDVTPLKLTARERRDLLLFLREGLQDSPAALKATIQH